MGMVDSCGLDHELNIAVHVIFLTTEGTICIVIRADCIQTIQDILKVIIHDIREFFDSIIIKLFCSVSKFLCSIRKTQ